ncbi:MAG: nuclear transport factor 2 family protein [Pseudomonadales bacterium]
MTLSLQQISDRIEIEDLIWHYSDIINRKAFEELRSVFTEDAHIDYSVFGGSKGSLEDTIKFLVDAMGIFPYTQHLNANMQVKLDGDTATGHIMCFNPQEMRLGKGETQTFMLGLWYNDIYVRTNEGWRIKERSEQRSWKFNTPEFMSFLDD